MLRPDEHAEDHAIRKAVFWSLGVLAVLLSLGAFARFHSGVVPAKVRGESQTFQKVASWAACDAGTAVAGRPFAVFVGVENQGDTPILVTASIASPGLTPIGHCWADERLTCLARGVGLEALSGAWLVHPGGSAEWTAEAIATEAGSFHSFMAQLEIDLGARPGFVGPPAADQVHLALARLPLRAVESAGWFRVGAVSAFLIDFFKDFGLPIIGAVIGFFFAWRLERIRQRQQALEQAESRVRESWNQMLPRVHSNAEHYYMPMSSALQAFRQELERFDRRHPERDSHLREEATVVDKLFFHLVTLFLRHDRMRREIGGYYFKSRLAESVVAAGWNILRDRLVERPSDVLPTDQAPYKIRSDHLSRLLAALPSEPSLEDLSKLGAGSDESPGRELRVFWPSRKGSSSLGVKLGKPLGPADEPGTDTALQSAKESARLRFTAWLCARERKQVLEDLSVFHLLEDLLDYSMNVPYDEWYGSETKLDVAACQQRIDGLVHRPYGETEATLERFKAEFAELSKSVRQAPRV